MFLDQIVDLNSIAARFGFVKLIQAAVVPGTLVAKTGTLYQNTATGVLYINTSTGGQGATWVTVFSQTGT